MLFNYDRAFVISLPKRNAGIPPIKRSYFGKGDPREKLTKDEWHHVVFADYIFRVETRHGGIYPNILVRVMEGFDDTEFIVKNRFQYPSKQRGKRGWHYRLTDRHYYLEAEENNESAWTVDYVSRQLRRVTPHLFDHCEEGFVGVDMHTQQLYEVCPKNRIVERIEQELLMDCKYFGSPDVDELYEKHVRYCCKPHSPKEVVVENVCNALIDAYSEYLF